jgi:hypothetical protein
MRTIDLFSVQEKLTKMDLLEAIKNAQGRTLLTELFTSKPALLGDVSNMETARAFGSDLLLLNDVDLSNLRFPGLENTFNCVDDLKVYVGCPVGIDLYMIHPDNKGWPGPELSASIENLDKVVALGFDFINLVADPVMGLSNEALLTHLMEIPNTIKDQVVMISGRMNFAGLKASASQILTPQFIEDIAKTGIDILLIPTPGSAQGMDMSLGGELVKLASEKGLMTMSGIGSSQEGADLDTIRSLALNARMLGVDIHHLGDAGYVSGMATPENIMTYSIVIKGKRHTYRKMARR